MAAKRVKKRRKKSGIVYFAVNNRIPEMVKIGRTIDSAEKRLEYANRKNEFMCGIWSITQKVKTNDVKRTEALAHELYEDYFDNKSISQEMFFLPPNKTVKEMADEVRDKDKIKIDQIATEEEAIRKVKEAQKALDKLSKQHKDELLGTSDPIEEE